MKRFIIINLFLLILFTSILEANVSAHKEGYNCKFYRAYITGNMEQWPQWITELKQEYQRDRSPELLQDIVKAYYGFIAYSIGVDDYETADVFLEKGEAWVDKLKEIKAYKSTAYAYEGAFLAFEIGMNRAKAIFLGPKSMKHIHTALEIDPENPMALVEKGNAEYHMPRMFGGSYEKAAEYYEKAIVQFEANGPQNSCSWIYLNTLAWLAQSYDKSGEVQKARTTFQKILSLEPDFKWVKEELFPEFQKRH